MAAVGVALVCSVTAVIWALFTLRRMVNFIGYDPKLLREWLILGTYCKETTIADTSGNASTAMDAKARSEHSGADANCNESSKRRLQELNRVLNSVDNEHESWQPQIVEGIVKSHCREQAMARVNETLLLVDVQLDPAWRVYAATSRICVFGGLLAVTVLLIQGRVLSEALVDVFAIAGSAVLIMVMIAKSARRFSQHQRVQIDAWIETMMKLRWPQNQAL